MTNLELITNEKFHNVDCDFYRSENQILLTREQIGEALEYSNPSKAIRTIHLKHKERLEKLCIRIKSNTVNQPQIKDSRISNLMTEKVYYTERGVMEICRWSRQPKANEFMDWVFDIVDDYWQNSLQSPDYQNLAEQINLLNKKVLYLCRLVGENPSLPKSSKFVKHKPSDFYKSMEPKYKLLMEYLSCTRKELYSSIYRELEDLCNVNINEIYLNFCINNNLSTGECYIMDVIENDINLRNALVLLVDSQINKFNS